MKLRDYQRIAKKTDQFPTRQRAGRHGEPDKSELVPLLGLTGEIGTLLSEYKKLLRDGPVHLRFKDRVSEELGDTLWYVATVATKFGLSLETIAEANLEKVSARWLTPSSRRRFDSAYPTKEQLPRKFTFRFDYCKRNDGSLGVAFYDQNGKQLGDLLTDNAYKSDGYRFHDVMHFAFVALLGWSPVARKLLGAKRRSKQSTNEIEDGGRASVIDEAIVAMIFSYIGHDLRGTKNMKRVDSETLRAIRALTRGYEVNARTELEWENAIIAGLDVWRQVEAHDGGVVSGDFERGEFTFTPPAPRKADKAASRARAPGKRRLRRRR